MKPDRVLLERIAFPCPQPAFILGFGIIPAPEKEWIKRAKRKRVLGPGTGLVLDLLLFPSPAIVFPNSFRYVKQPNPQVFPDVARSSNREKLVHPIGVSSILDQMIQRMIQQFHAEWENLSSIAVTLQIDTHEIKPQRVRGNRLQEPP
jgi:hypothetical protein